MVDRLNLRRQRMISTEQQAESRQQNGGPCGHDGIAENARCRSLFQSELNEHVTCGQENQGGNKGQNRYFREKCSLMGFS